MFLSAFLCLLAGLHENYLTDFRKYSAERSWKKPLVLDSNSDHVSYVRVEGRYSYGELGPRYIPQHLVCFTRRFFNSNSFTGSVVSPEVCALLNVLLISETENGVSVLQVLPFVNKYRILKVNRYTHIIQLIAGCIQKRGRHGSSHG